MSQRLQDLKWPAVIALTVTITALAVSAIVVKSERLASPERPATQEKLATPAIPAPPILAQILLAPKMSDGDAALDTPFFDAREEPLSLSALTKNAPRGQGLVLNLWATWCAPCVREMPALDRLAAKLKDRGVRVVALSQDRRALDVVPPFYADTGIENLDLYYDVKSRLSRALGVGGLPTTVLIDAGGREIGRVKGAVEWDDDAIVDYVAKILAAP